MLHMHMVTLPMPPLQARTSAPPKVAVTQRSSSLLRTTRTLPLSLPLLQRQPLLLVLLLLTLLQQPIAVVDAQLLGGLFSIFAGKCSGSEARCGLGGLGYQVRTGLDGTDQCKDDVCIYFPIFNANIECGAECGPVTGTVPPAPGGDNGNFDVFLDMDAIPLLDRNRFRTAASRWERIITEDLLDINGADLPNPPRYDSCRYPTTIDDLYICSAYVTRDGVGGTLGFATVGFIRSADSKPLTGTMSFDTADMAALKANNDIDAVLLHEIGHLLGVGTRWEGQGVAGPDSAGCPYLGQKATAEYRSVSGCSTLPTEQDGGSGTVCSHFDEQCLQRELMTGAVNTGVQNFLSRITIASLEDLGYSVSYSTADAFRASNLGPGCSCRRRGLGETSSSARDDDTWQHINTTSTSSSSSSSPSRRRRLSDEMYQYAQEQGQWYLNSQPSLPVAVMADLNDKGVRYVGDQYVSVIVRDEDGGIFDVEVYKEKE